MKHSVLLTSTEHVSKDVVAHRDVMIPMRDGVHLATDIYMPVNAGRKGDTPLPVILERTPYDKAGIPRSEFSLDQPTALSREELAIRLVRENYIVIWQDCRGRFGSEGNFVKYLNEAEDGFDTMEWIVAQPWNNSKIGTMGLSYDAHTQMAMACLNPPGLICMVIDSGGFSNAFTCGIRQGGALELKQATWAYNRAGDSPLAARDPLIKAAIEAENLKDWFTKMPWTKGRSPIRWDPDYEEYLLDQWQHGTFDEFWKRPGLWAAAYYDTFPKVPIILMSSWYDVYVQTTLENYQGLKGGKDNPLSLIMGCWTHGDRSERVFGDVDFGDDAPFDSQVDVDWLTYRIRWFAKWLKGEETQEFDSNTVRYFLMGGGSGAMTKDGHLDHGGKWYDGDDWPLPAAQKMRFYLNEDMGLHNTPSIAEKSEISYDFDPQNPVPTIGGAITSGEPLMTGGGFNQVEKDRFFGCTQPGIPLIARKDILSFQSEILTQDFVVAGPVKIKLWVSTNAPDTDFTAKLVDVYPPSNDYPSGYALNVTDGILRVRYRKSFENPSLVLPEEGPFEIIIHPFATANLFARGHRLRLDISSSNFPKYDVNPNTGEPEGSSRRSRIATNTVHLDKILASYLEVQIVDNHDTASPGAHLTKEVLSQSFLRPE